MLTGLAPLAGSTACRPIDEEMKVTVVKKIAIDGDGPLPFLLLAAALPPAAGAAAARAPAAQPRALDALQRWRRGAGLRQQGAPPTARRPPLAPRRADADAPPLWPARLRDQVGPYVNPSETYNYYDLPFCQHNSMEVPKQSLGETLKGDELTRSLFDVRFKSERLSHRSAAAALRCRRAPLPPRSAASPIGCLGRAADVRMATLCELDFTAAEYQQLRHAIEDDYYFEFVTDKLPMWGFVGETKVEGGVDRPYLFTHLHFHFAYNGDQLIEATVSTDAKLETMLVDPAGGAGGGEGGHGGGGGGGGGSAAAAVPPPPPPRRAAPH